MQVSQCFAKSLRKYFYLQFNPYCALIKDVVFIIIHLVIDLSLYDQYLLSSIHCLNNGHKEQTIFEADFDETLISESRNIFWLHMTALKVLLIISKTYFSHKSFSKNCTLLFNYNVYPLSL